MVPAIPALKWTFDLITQNASLGEPVLTYKYLLFVLRFFSVRIRVFITCRNEQHLCSHPLLSDESIQLEDETCNGFVFFIYHLWIIHLQRSSTLSLKPCSCSSCSCPCWEILWESPTDSRAKRGRREPQVLILTFCLS